MIYRYVGLIKGNSLTSQVLVQSTDGKFYVWKANNERLEVFNHDGDVIRGSELTLATTRQIEVGRGTVWSPNQSKVMLEVYYYGVVSGGKSKKTILVGRLKPPGWFITTIPSDSLVCLMAGDLIRVDFRKLSPAREDHVKAGLGYGKLKRKRRAVPVS